MNLARPEVAKEGGTKLDVKGELRLDGFQARVPCCKSRIKVIGAVRPVCER